MNAAVLRDYLKSADDNWLDPRSLPEQTLPPFFKYFYVYLFIFFRKSGKKVDRFF